MKGTKRFQLIGSFLLFVFLICLATVRSSIAVETIDEFDLPKLNEDPWDMKVVGKASYEIKDGILTMSSPDKDEKELLGYMLSATGMHSLPVYYVPRYMVLWCPK